MFHPIIHFFLICILFECYCFCEESSYLQTLRKSMGKCLESEDWLKCFKIQTLKVTDRAIRIKFLTVVEGLDIVGNDRLGRVAGELTLNDKKLENLTHDDLNSLLADRTAKFLETHRLALNIPQIAEVADKVILEEGRGRRRRQRYPHAALMAALAIKGSFLAMAYQGIAVMSGTALIVGKMALLLAAILGLKKLVHSNQEKTTFEIIKTPKYAEEHHHSTSYEDDYHDHRRNFLEGSGEAHKRVYRFQMPQ